MNVRIHPKQLKGSLWIPPSKSLSHRAIIAAGLAKGTSKISNVILSKDILATIEAMRVLGAMIEINGNELRITGSSFGQMGDGIDAFESGSTLRFMIPIALSKTDNISFIGRNQLVHRPLDTYFELFDQYGISYTHPKDAYLPLQIKGKLQAGIYQMRGDISSQFLTGLLYALPMLDGDSKILLTTPLESKGYVDLTLDMLSKFGISIKHPSEDCFEIEGNQSYLPFDYSVEGDYSQSAFYLVAGALGAELELLGMAKDSFQGDQKIIEDILNMNGDIKFVGEKLYSYPSPTKGTTIDFSQSPDLGPALTVLASLSEGTSEFIHAGRLRIKECDRISCMKQELEKMGAVIIEHPEGMTIHGVKQLSGAVLDSHNDHRVAMALAMASLKTKGDIVIKNAEAVTKSYPHFWEDFKKLGGDISYE